MTEEDFKPVRVPFYALVLIFLFCWPSTALSEPLFRVTTPDGIVITLHKEKCEMKEISNLPRTATWDEKGKTFQGCWGASELGVVMLYFSDKTMAVVPIQVFEKVTGV